MKRKNPIDAFFTLGDKVTGGDPKRKADYDYYLMWVIFLAFFLIAYSNFKAFIDYGNLSSLGWGVVVLCIIWFQYSSLKMAYDARKLMKEVQDTTSFNKIEDVNDMD